MGLRRNKTIILSSFSVLGYFKETLIFPVIHTFWSNPMYLLHIINLEYIISVYIVAGIFLPYVIIYSIPVYLFLISAFGKRRSLKIKYLYILIPRR
jgi:hypothetical protein